MKVIDNITNILRDDLQLTIQKDSKVSIAAACFSMYAYSVLKKQLESIDEFRFIFTSPTFVSEKTEKQKKTARASWLALFAYALKTESQYGHRATLPRMPSIGPPQCGHLIATFCLARSTLSAS